MIRAVVAACLLLTAPAIAQPAGSTLGGLKVLPAGAPVRAGPGAAGSTDVYAFVTMPGDSHTFTVRTASTKPLELLFIDAAGNVILSKSGMREVELDAVASWADAYAVAVIRADPAIPYTLQRATAPATLEQLVIAHATGYESSEDGGYEKRCWVTPGRKMRSIFRRSTTEREALPGQLFTRTTPTDGRPPTNSSISLSVVADKMHSLVRGASGERAYQTEFTQERFEQVTSGYRFTGYLC